jgi:ribonuclease III
MNEQKSMLDSLQLKIGHSFQNLKLLELAILHASVVDRRHESNERLEFLGDAVLGMIVCHELYIRFPRYLEGELTKIKSMIVSRKTCADVTEKTGLTQFLRTGKGMSAHRKLPRSCSAALYESVIGAIFLDGGLEPARKFVLSTIGHILDEADANRHQENFKSMLQQHAQRTMETTPVYELLDEKGPDHSKCFEVGVVIGNHRFTGAWGTSKKEAEQLAALQALRELKLLPPENP